MDDYQNPWPGPDSKLFDEPGLSEHRGMAFPQLGPSWGFYSSGYEDAVGFMLDAIERGENDSLAYPLLFCARHAVELRLKELRARLAELGEVELEPKPEHSLLTLWEEVVTLTEACGLDPWDGAEFLGALLAELHATDTGSLNYRYPEALTGSKPSFQMRQLETDSRGFPKPDGIVIAGGTFPSLIGVQNLRHQLAGMFNYLSAATDMLEDQERS